MNTKKSISGQSDEQTAARSASQTSTANSTNSDSAKAESVLDEFILRTRMLLAQGVAPERIVKMYLEIESGEQPNIAKAMTKLYDVNANLFITQLEMINNIIKPYVEAAKRTDLTIPESHLVASMFAKHQALTRKIMPSVEE